MIEAIGFAILTAASALGATGAAALGTATVLGVSGATIIGTAAVLGGSLLVQSLLTQDVREKVAAQQFQTRQAMPPRRRAYGTVKLSGPYTVRKSYAGIFYSDTYLAEGPIESILDYWLDDQRAALPVGALVGTAGVYPWFGYVLLEGHLGAPDQAASTLLSPLPFRTANHRLRGCAHIAMAATAPPEKFFVKFFPSGAPPALRALIKASRVRNINDAAQTADPATWTWNDNAGLCIYDLVTHPDYGLRLDADLIDLPSWKAHAALCSEPVTDRYGASYPRYYLGGLFDLTDQFADVLGGMLQACASDLYLSPEGKVGITGGRYVAPDVTIPASAILSIGSLEVGNGLRATVNRLKTSYVSPLHDWQVIEGASWDDAEGQADLGEALEADFPRPWVQNHNQLMRLAKIDMAKRNPAYRIAGMVTSLAGAPALYEDAVNVDLSRYGLGTLPFRVDRPVLASDGATCVFDLSSLDPSAWSFDPASEEPERPATPDSNTGDLTPPVPSGLVPLIERRTVSAGTIATFLRLKASEPARADLSLVGRYRRVGDADWSDMAPDGDSPFSIISSVLIDGATYEYQAALATYGRAQQSPWTPTTPAQIVATADEVAPAAPTYLTLSGPDSAGQVSHTGRMPNSANARSLRLMRARGFGKIIADASIVDSQAGSPNATLALSDTIDLGLYTYWLQALNGSGVASDPSASKSAGRYMQAGNLLSSPYDFTAAAWGKTALTASAAPAGPDGNGATQIIETMAATGHGVDQSVSIASGSELRLAVGIKAVGRNLGRISIISGGAVGQAYVNYDLADGTVSGIATAGVGVTAVAAEITRVSSGYWLVMLTAIVSSATASANVRVANDAGAVSYAGDTAKGVVLWSASLAVVS